MPSLTPNPTSLFLLVTVLVVLLPVQTYAFGAGDIPDFAYLNDKAFRHGDIENILETLTKSAGHASLSGGIFGIASSVIKQVAGGSKFTKNDIKKVYFGNWLRDYSQAMDIAGLSKLSADTIVLVISILGFMTFGYTTQEFEITADRLGVYLPVEHIDNPKGYAEKEGDARNFHPKLRPPVQREELEIDESTGMKKYMATENRGWDTSTGFIRRTLRACIEHGRRANGNENADLWEAYRLLGTGLHTLEDLLAHSNWCEIALRKLGYNDVFCHVGDRVSINTPNGRAPPLVTGTFGSADFLHSLLGEAGDKLSQASVTDLSQKMDQANQNSDISKKLSALKNTMSKISGGDGGDTQKVEQIQAQSQAYHFDPNNVAPPEVRQRLSEVLRWHDDVMRNISKKIEMVPGLTNLLEELSNAMNEYIYTVLAPYVVPILTQATSVLDEGSKAVIDNDDQYEVFNNPNAHDPSHSMLSKDHFGLILNEPAGKIAQVVVEHTVKHIVEAWSNNDNPDDIVNKILEAFHHPYYATGRSEIQRRMFDTMSRWIGSQGQDTRQIIQALSKESVKDHKNKRIGMEDVVEPGYHGCGGHGKPNKRPSGVGVGVGVGAAAGGYAASRPSQGSQGYGGNQKPSHGSSGGYGGNSGRRDDDNAGYGSQRRDDNTSSGIGGGYGSQNQRRDDNSGYSGGGYGSSRKDNDSNTGGGYGGGYGSQSGGGGYGSQSGGGYGSQSGGGYGSQSGGGYGSQSGGGGYGSHSQSGGGGYGSQKRDDDNSGGYGRRKDDDDRRGNQGNTYGSSGGYGGGSSGYNPSYQTPSYGQRKDDDDDDKKKKKYGRDNDSDDDRKKKKSGRGNDSDDDNKGRQGQGYGGSGGYGGGGSGYGYGGNTRKDDDDNRGGYGGGRKKDDSDDEKKRRKQGGYGGGGYGRQDDSDDEKKRRNQGGGYGGGAYGRKDDSDDEKKRRNQGGYGGGGYGGRKDDSDDEKNRRGGGSGHGGRGGGRSDDTYGVDRLNIGGGRGGRGGRDNDSDDEKKGRKQQQQGYGGGGYGGGNNYGYGGGGRY